jgi:threonylcarbamoyladenosine tRNA methylthiotransferase MtaB
MRRRYGLDDYKELILKLNETIPGIGIGVDVIIGFPGETEDKFENTYNFLKALPVSYLHVFSYSERRNTHAVSLPGRVDINDRKKRSRLLRELSAFKKYSFYIKNSGKTHKVLFETINNDGYIYGFTDNYIRVRTEGNPELENRIIDFRIQNTTENIIAEGMVSVS